MDAILLYSGGAIIFLWGLAHILPTRQIVEGFGDISRDNRLTIAMTWISEGFLLCFVGALVFVFTLLRGANDPASAIVYIACVIMLLLATLLSLFTGARTSVIPMKVCPGVKTLCAVLIAVGMLM